MKRFLWAMAVLALVAGGSLRGQNPGAPQIALHATTQEVLLDLVARDKHHKLVADLRPQDIEILEDGVPQTLRSLRYRSGREEAAGQSDTLRRWRYSALRQISLVTLLFEGLDMESRPQAVQAARDFLANGFGPDTYVAVFLLNQRLKLVQSYTNDRGLLERAIDRLAGGPYLQSAKDTVAASGKSQSGAPLESSRPTPMGQPSADVEKIPGEMEELTEMILDYEGHLSIDALQQLIRAQAQLRGRKTVLFFGEGLTVPPNFPESFRALISAANRANVAFYTVEPSGLSTELPVPMSEGIARATGRDNLRYLAEDTGGFAIADTNDVRVPMRRVMEEMKGHYEAAYSPKSTNYDGHFRIIEVRARRPGLQLQSRNGYFALPLLGGEAVEPFELAGLAALDAKPLPHAFDFHIGMLGFRADAGESECRTVFSVPSRSLHFTDDSRSKLFRLHVTFLALLKDEQNQIVLKLSRDLPFQAPADRKAEFARGEVTVILPLRLAPGRYHVEAAVHDVDGRVASTKRFAVVVPAEAERRVAMSDLVLVRSVQPADVDRDSFNPLRFAGGKVTPEMNFTIVKSPGAAEGIYFVIYPVGDARPEVTVAIFRNGQVVNSARPDLPTIEADGSYRVWSRIAFGGFDPGVYEIKVTATQGGATVGRAMAVEVSR